MSCYSDTIFGITYKLDLRERKWITLLTDICKTHIALYRYVKFLPISIHGAPSIPNSLKGRMKITLKQVEQSGNGWEGYLRTVYITTTVLKIMAAYPLPGTAQ